MKSTRAVPKDKFEKSTRADPKIEYEEEKSFEPIVTYTPAEIMQISEQYERIHNLKIIQEWQQ